jgi:hypothetical protein
MRGENPKKKKKKRIVRTAGILMGVDNVPSK